MMGGRRSATLRNHKKILVVDGKRGFIGGLNISAHNLKAAEPRSAVRDMHFEVTGPVVSQIAEAFVLDWEFATGEELQGESWFPAPDESGQALARVINLRTRTRISRRSSSCSCQAIGHGAAADQDHHALFPGMSA